MVSLPKHGMFDGISGRSPIAADLALRKASLANKDLGLSSEMVDFNHKNNVHIFGVHYLVGDLEHDFYFPFHIWDVILPIEKKNQRGRYTTNQFYTKMAVVSPAEALKWVRQSANPKSKSFFTWILCGKQFLFFQ